MLTSSIGTASRWGEWRAGVTIDAVIGRSRGDYRRKGGERCPQSIHRLPILGPWPDTAENPKIDSLGKASMPPSSAFRRDRCRIAALVSLVHWEKHLRYDSRRIFPSSPPLPPLPPSPPPAISPMLDLCAGRRSGPQVLIDQMIRGQVNR